MKKATRFEQGYICAVSTIHQVRGERILESNDYGEIACECNRCGNLKQSLEFIICDNFRDCAGVYVETIGKPVIQYTEEQVLNAVYESGLHQYAPSVIFAKWKDGIDIDVPTLALMNFVGKLTKKA